MLKYGLQKKLNCLLMIADYLNNSSPKEVVYTTQRPERSYMFSKLHLVFTN